MAIELLLNKVDIPPDGVAMLDIPTLFEITYDDYQSTTLKLRHFKETVRSYLSGSLHAAHTVDILGASRARVCDRRY